MPNTDWSKLGPVKGCFRFRDDSESERAMLESLDPGIRRIVQTLRENNVETVESCEGSAGHIFTVPTVRFLGDLEAGYKAFIVAIKERLPIFNLRRTWSVNSHYEMSGPIWEMTFIFVKDDLPNWTRHDKYQSS